MAINNANHEGNPQDGYNKIQNGNYPYQQMVDESEYVLTQQEDVTYKVTKKPKDATITKVTDLQDFLKDQNKVLVVYASGRYDRYNFDPEGTSETESGK